MSLSKLVTAACVAGVVGCSPSPPASSGAAAPSPATNLVRAVRAANTAGDAARARHLVETAREVEGTTPTVLLAQSWVGRGALSAGDLDTAEAVARRTYADVQEALKIRGLDDEPELPLALGASIEVLANVAVAREARSEAVTYLEGELARYGETSIATRLQKNINLLSLEGEEPPSLSSIEFLGERPPPTLEALEGRVVLMFFWAHWCSDCKAQSPVIERLVARYGSRGLSVLAPTQRYGYVAAGKDASPDDEAAYIARMWAASYTGLAGTPVHLDAANLRRYGVSTTPTLVLVDRGGRIRLYHPGQMAEDGLEPLVRELIDATPETS